VTSVHIATAGTYLLLAKLNFVSNGGATFVCTLSGSDGGNTDDFTIKAGDGFDTSNTLMLVHTFASADQDATVNCSVTEDGRVIVVKSATLAALQVRAG
jgi:hypothetical protein